mmetsp:Transcript_112171/g.312211  ORF Transcript_112171/g.312211 Transcript_112171/m.312211 type:complete len:146 (-) Transcript_112171:218-655(-)
MLSRLAVAAVLLSQVAEGAGVPELALAGDDPCLGGANGDGQCDISLRQLRGELRIAEVADTKQQEREEGTGFTEHGHQKCDRYTLMAFGDLRSAEVQCSGKSSSWCTGVMGPVDGKYYMCEDPMQMFPVAAVGGASSSSVWTRST